MKQRAIKIATVYLGLMLSFNTSAFAQGTYSNAADFLFEIGKECYELGDYQQALHEFEKALLAEPEHAQALMYIQIIEKELGLSEEEVEEIRVSPEEFAREEAVSRALEEAKGKIIAAEEGISEVEEEIEIEPIVEETEGVPEETIVEEIITEEPYRLLERGRTFIECYNKYYWHNTEFNEDGERQRWAYNGRYRDVQTELKIEHGLTENLTLLGSVPYKVALWKDDSKRNITSGVGDIWMRLKYNIWDQLAMPFTFYAQPGLRVPGGYDENDVPSLGGGELAGELRFLGVRSFSALPCYSKIETGYRYRADEFTDEIPYFFEFGYHPTDWFLFKTTVDGIEGLAGTGDEEEDWTKWTVHTVFSPKGGFGTFRQEGILNFELSYGNTFEGKNTGNGSEVVINITYQF